MALEPPLYTTEEVAERDHVKPTTVHRWVREGRINALNMGGSRRGPYRFRVSDLEEFEGRAEIRQAVNARI